MAVDGYIEGFEFQRKRGKQANRR